MIVTTLSIRMEVTAAGVILSTSSRDLSPPIKISLLTPVLNTPAGFLEGLRKLCDAHGSLLIFDEVISGFRASAGGAQQTTGVRPDLTRLSIQWLAVLAVFGLWIIAGRDQPTQGAIAETSKPETASG